jgi:glyoxylase-like metal-dependent hydrolase (beta-lactamase superfamily II)
MATAVKRQHEPQRIVGDVLNAEINEKQARSIKYQLTIAKLPLAKEAGVSLDSITHVLMTHIHPDHSDGLIDESGN